MTGESGRMRLGQWMRILMASFVFVLVASLTGAQSGDCPAMQNRAIAELAAACAEQSPDTLCYGHPTVSIMVKPEAEAINFGGTGELVSLGDIAWLSASSESKTWGMARMLFPVYPLASLEAQTASLLIFGDAALFQPSQAFQPTPLLEVVVEAARGANLREEPHTSASVITTLVNGSPVKAIRHSDDETWIQVYAAPEQIGWISESLIAGDISRLGKSAPEHVGAPLWFPWQVFDFKTGIDDAACDGAPSSGLLLQTPRFHEALPFWVNGLETRLNGTAFLQAQIDAGMTVYVLDGEAVVTAADATVSLPSGYYTRVPLTLDEDGATVVLEGPTVPSPYDYQRMLVLPISALHYPARVGLDAYTIISRRPSGEDGPLHGLTQDSACKITVGPFGANIRARPDPDALIIATMQHRESADPIARAFGSDDLLWWKLADHVWIRIDVTVMGGNCSAIPLIAYEG